MFSVIFHRVTFFFQLAVPFDFVTTRNFTSVPLAGAIRSEPNQSFMTYIPAGFFIYECINYVNIFFELFSQNISKTFILTFLLVCSLEHF